MTCFEASPVESAPSLNQPFLGMSSHLRLSGTLSVKYAVEVNDDNFDTCLCCLKFGPIPVLMKDPSTSR